MKWKIVFICYILSAFVYSQTSDSTKLTHGQFALQARFLDSFELSNFEGAGISFKYHVSNKLAFRFGIDNKISDLDSSYTPSHSTDDTFKDYLNIDHTEFNLFAHFVYYMNAVDDISFYVGGGPYYQHEVQKHEVIFTYGNREFVEDVESTANIYGLEWICGLEWFVWEQVGLHLEYSIQVQKVYYNMDRTRNNEYEEPERYYSEDKDGWNILEGPFRFGVSIYF